MESKTLVFRLISSIRLKKDNPCEVRDIDVVLSFSSRKHILSVSQCAQTGSEGNAGF